MVNRVILTYRKDNTDEKHKRLYIRDGVVQNLEVETHITENMADFTAIKIRRTGEGVRSLIHVEEVSNV